VLIVNKHVNRVARERIARVGCRSTRYASPSGETISKISKPRENRSGKQKNLQPFTRSGFLNHG
jgi:hypothetical protein